MNTPVPLTTQNKVCANCRFHEMEAMQGQIQRMMVCHRMPPTISMVPTQQGIQGMTMFPVVKPSDWCYEWQQREHQQNIDSAKAFGEHAQGVIAERRKQSDPILPGPARARELDIQRGESGEASCAERSRETFFNPDGDGDPRDD